ncbi:phage tail tube protein [Goodfellowiella coeruleoviolacea]|uniref:Tail protein n=1 Tax=Goodfellowiella coeruleoviolacea TaxID=334858 RepID=A0AAE3GLF4_9PSEU|nr:phage tail tube protein [Goodfellowiella coeruleoviolacea]MCP2168133.1 hypothetical protein [Goodfellowiella coeruleoviolacea]
MAIPSGLSAQLGVGEETTYGTAVTPSRFYEFRQESVSLSIERLASTALRAGARVLRSDRWAPGQRSVSGDITMEVGTEGYGLWLKHALGSVTSTQPDATNAPTVWRHVFTPGDLPPGLTVQIGRPDTGGVVRPFTYSGCRVSSWTLECSVGEFLTLQVSLLGRDETTATALATAAYPAGSVPLTFVTGSLSLGGTETCVRSVSIAGSNALAEDRYCIGGGGLRDVPVEQGLREITGTLEGEFKDLTAYNRFTNGEEAELVLTFQGPVISGTLRHELVLTANTRFDGATPAVGGPEIVMQSLPIVVTDTGTQSVRVEYQTTDTTP